MYSVFTAITKVSMVEKHLTLGFSVGKVPRPAAMWWLELILRSCCDL